MSRRCAVTVLFALALAAPAVAAEPKLEVATLKNGLKIIVEEDHSAPVVALAVAYRAGSRNEHPGIKGIAHLFEHMMFKGSKKYGPEAHMRELEAHGATYNAFTQEDQTVYFELMPKEEFPTLMAMEADRMGTLQLSDAMLTSERQVVKEEYRMRLQTNPVSQVYEAFLAKAFVKHPYAWTPAGALDDLDKITVKDCQDFYRTYYAPNNAVVVVVGDTTLKEVKALAEKEFGPLAKQKAPPPVAAVEPPQKERRDVGLELEAELPVLIGGYHVPPANDRDADALNVLATILSAGESSRLHKSLVREQKVAPFAAGFFQPKHDPGMFVIVTAYQPPHDAKEAETALLAEIGKVRSGGVTEEELGKARSDEVSSRAFGQLSQLGRAQGIAAAEVVEGDYKRYLARLARLDKVTAADVKKVAEKYLVDSNLTLATLKQKPGETAPAPDQAPAQNNAPMKEAK
jgi:zinc protease